jgi:hypothetical protein
MSDERILPSVDPSMMELVADHWLTTVHQHAQNYKMARNVYNKIKDVSSQSPELPKLGPADLQVNTAILGAAQRGQQNKQLLWVWSFGISDKKDATWIDECT